MEEQNVSKNLDILLGNAHVFLSDRSSHSMHPEMGQTWAKSRKSKSWFFFKFDSWPCPNLKQNVASNKMAIFKFIIIQFFKRLGPVLVTGNQVQWLLFRLCICLKFWLYEFSSFRLFVFVKNTPFCQPMGFWIWKKLRFFS